MIHIIIPTTKERRQRLAECIETIHEFAGVPHIISTYENYQEGFVTPCYKLVKDLHPDTMVWCIGDDTRLTEPDTLKRLLEVYNKIYPNKDGVVQPDDGIQNGQIITMPLCTAKTMLDRGLHLEFFLNYCDNLFTDIMARDRKYTYCPEIKVEHHHHINGKAKKDETYTYASSKFMEDQQTYYKLKKQMGL